jgi:hypothetical protein
MLKAFKQCLADPDFKYSEYFSCFCSRTWKECTALQPADFVAYINFKESKRILSGRKRSKPLELLIGLETFGGGVKFLGEEALKSLKEWLDTRPEREVPRNE